MISSTYEVYAQQLGANISRPPFVPTPYANFEEDNAELENLFEGIRSERFDAQCSSSSISIVYHDIGR